MSIFWGTANTAVLIASSFTMAMGVWSAEMRRKGTLLLCLSLTFMLGLGFLGIKSIEWHEKWEKHHVPGFHHTASRRFSIRPRTRRCTRSIDDKPLPPDMAQKTELYFFLYFAMTGMHALHMIIGIRHPGIHDLSGPSRGLHHGPRDVC